MKIKNSICFLSLLFLSACSSVVPTKTPDLTGVQKLAAWKAEGERLAANPNASQAKYDSARDQVNSLVLTTWPATIDGLKRRPSGKINLTESEIPSTVSEKVSEFFASVQPYGAGSDIEVKTELTATSVNAILNWAWQKSWENREKSAEELKQKISELQWGEWTTVHKP